MSGARKAVDSTLRRILIYTAEIIMSVVLLIVICLPLVFSIPMWLQTVALGVSRSELFLDPVAMLGTSGALLVTLLLSGLSVVVGYLYVSRLAPSATSDEEVAEEEEEEED
ncbi:MAG: hypothetical protein ACFFD9_07015 [Candidatus Thorarchaeota archaeon]